MEIFPVDPNTNEINTPGLGMFALLPVELRDEILFHVCEGEFPFGSHRPVPSVPESRIIVLRKYRNVTDEVLREATTYPFHRNFLVNQGDAEKGLGVLRRAFRFLLSLGTTSRYFYMAVRERHMHVYRTLAGYQQPFEYVLHSSMKIAPRRLKHFPCDLCFSLRPIDTTWYVAAARLCLWQHCRIDVNAEDKVDETSTYIIRVLGNDPNGRARYPLQVTYEQVVAILPRNEHYSGCSHM